MSCCTVGDWLGRVNVPINVPVGLYSNTLSALLSPIQTLLFASTAVAIGACNGCPTAKSDTTPKRVTFTTLDEPGSATKKSPVLWSNDTPNACGRVAIVLELPPGVMRTRVPVWLETIRSPNAGATLIVNACALVNPVASCT